MKTLTYLFLPSVVYTSLYLRMCTATTTTNSNKVSLYAIGGEAEGNLHMVTEQSEDTL